MSVLGGICSKCQQRGASRGYAERPTGARMASLENGRAEGVGTERTLCSRIMEGAPTKQSSKTGPKKTGEAWWASGGRPPGHLAVCVAILPRRCPTVSVPRIARGATMQDYRQVDRPRKSPRGCDWSAALRAPQISSLPVLSGASTARRLLILQHHVWRGPMALLHH